MPTSKSLEQSIKLTNDPASVLCLTIGANTPTLGSIIPKGDAQAAPTLSFTSADPSKTYLAACLDLDAPFRSFAFLSPILHWIQPGFKCGANGALESSTPVLVNYVAPNPPPGSGPHRYVFILYEQPTDFDASKFAATFGNAGLSSRIRFNWDDWVKQAGLVQPVAANYFTSN